MALMIFISLYFFGVQDRPIRWPSRMFRTREYRDMERHGAERGGYVKLEALILREK